MKEKPNTETIGSRAKEVREGLGLNQQAIADRIGISLRAWQKMERDEGTPSGETLLNFEKVGFNPGWILAGLGPKKLLTWTSADAEAELFMRIGDLVQEAHKDVGIELPTRGLAKIARVVFERVMQGVDPQAGPDEINAVLAGESAKLKRQLREAASEPGNGKRSA